MDFLHALHMYTQRSKRSHSQHTAEEVATPSYESLMESTLLEADFNWGEPKTMR